MPDAAMAVILVVFLLALGQAWSFQGQTLAFSRSKSILRVENNQKISFEDNSDINFDGGYRLNGYSMPAGQSPYQNSLEEKGKIMQSLFGLRPSPIVLEKDDDDGYSEMVREDKRKRALSWLRPLKTALFPKPPLEPGTLILVRHGETTWNANKTFTGWADPGLSERGIREVEHAARLLLEGGYEIDLIFCSRLKRAILSTWIILQEMNQVYKPVFKSWRLNERMYGALTGLGKLSTAEELGTELVQEWRGSLRTRPPAVTVNDPYWPGRDRRYADLSADQIPLTESLMDCMERTAPVWEGKIKYELLQGRNVMVVAHANTLRGLVKTIDGISDEDIQEVSIPTGIPIIYKFDRDMKPIPPEGDRQTVSQVHMKGLFLEKPGLLQEALKREEEWFSALPGYNATMETLPLTSLELSLYKLKAARELGEWADQFIDPTEIPEDYDDGSDGNRGRPAQYQEDEAWAKGIEELKRGDQFDPDLPEFHDANKDLVNGRKLIREEEDEPVPVPTVISNHPCVKSLPSEFLVPGLGGVPTRKDAVIVIIRHGKTEHNKLGLFTGWEDAPYVNEIGVLMVDAFDDGSIANLVLFLHRLAKEGIEEAREAGRMLKKYGFEFDVVYTSWLSRAIDTAWHVMSEMDCLWLPIIKTWRLNERMYGKLTGLSKQMVRQRHGDEQFKAWRRGFDTPPPPVSSFSQHYPGNDQRYEKYLKDIRFSFRESLIRSIEKGSPTLHRKLPKSESLKDCMDRTIPFFTECIVPQAIDQGKRVLISSSENAIRGVSNFCESQRTHRLDFSL
jgi:2,3-bisphosphoglycerate-dependent phosphoglycerate mutase